LYQPLFLGHSSKETGVLAKKKDFFFSETLATSENTVNLCVTGLLTGTNVPNLPSELTVPNLLHGNSLILFYYNPPILPGKSPIFFQSPVVTILLYPFNLTL